MPNYSAGTAAVTIKPDASSFVRDLRGKLSSMRDPGFSVRVEADTGSARRETDSFRRDEERRGIDIDVDADTAGASAEMARWRAIQENDRITVKIDVDTSRLSRANGELAGLTRGIEMLGRSDALRLNIGTGLIAGIGPAVTGLVQVAASLQQVAQAGLALPGVFAGASASIGTLVLGLSGIKDAYDAVSSAAESSGADQAASARAATSASNQLRNANVDLERAYDDLGRATRDARRELTDLRVEQRGGMLDESRAILEAQKAREDIAAGNYSDIRDAQLRVLEADQRLIEVRARNAATAERLNEANAKGIAGNDAVVAANERVTRSQQQVADAQAAVADAGSKTSAAQDKATRAMERLGPSAQALVRTMVDMGPAFLDFRAAVSEPLLAGKAEEFRDFFTTVAPVAQEGMAGIARGWNRNISALFDSLGSDTGRGLMDRILGNTGDAQARLSKAIDPLVKGLGTLTAAGTDALPRLADGLTAVLERFRSFIVEADEDGRLEEWINDGIDGVASLGESVLNIGKSFTAITTAAGGGGTFLTWLQDATGRLQTFLNSAQGQEQLKKFFKESADFYHQTLRPVLEDVPVLLKGIHDGAVTYIGGLMTTISPLTEFLKQHPGLVQGAVAAYAAWKTIDGVTSLMDNLKAMNTMLGVTLPDSAAKGASKMTMALGPVAALAAAIIAVDPERHLTGDKSIKEAADQGDWGRVLFGDGWDWIRDKLGIGDQGNRVTPNTTGGGTGSATGGVPLPQLNAPAGTRDSGGVPSGTGTPGAQANAPAGTRDSGGLPPGFLPPKKEGGPTPSGRGPGPTGGWFAELHGDEWVLPKHARRAVGDDALWELTKGRRFQNGGYIDENGNPVTPGAAPGPVAPNPMSSGPGILNNVAGGIAHGVQAPIANATNLFGSLLGTQGQQNPAATFGQNLLGGILPGLGGAAGTTGGGQSLLPGIAGLFQAGGDQGLQQQWLSQTGNWLANWGANTLLRFGSTLLEGTLGFFGMGGLMQHPVLQGIGQTVGHLGGVANQLAASQMAGQIPAAGVGPGTVLGVGGGTITILDADGTPITIDAPSTAGTAGAPTNGRWGASPFAPGVLTSLPTRLGNEGGLQINTINVKRAVESVFPQIQTIGGYRQDALKWHPNGLAIDVMIPGGNTYGGANPEGKALGDQIYQYVMANKDKFGVDYIMWQEKDHYDHLHINTTGGGYPNSGGKPGSQGAGPGAPLKTAIPNAFRAGGPTPGPSDRAIPAILHGNEFVISSRGRSTVPDSFLHALNQGEIDAAALPQFRIGGDVAAGVPTPPRPRPVVPDAKQIIPPARPKIQPPTPPTAQPPAAVTPPTPAPPIAQAPAEAAPSQGPAAPSWTPPVGIIAPRTGIDHTLPWINQLISSSAAVAGNIASTAIQAVAAAGTMGASAAGGGMGAGMAGSLVAGGIQQGGKVVKDVANVISSALVGSVPGSFTDNPSGQIVRAEQNRPSVAEYRGGNTYSVTGYDPAAIAREIQLTESLDRQARLAAIPK